jgi:prepilin-type N-terminal cleavage/methylation domain-containing protein
MISLRLRLQESLSRSIRVEQGFSLIEVTVSLALLGIIGVGFLSALATVSKTTLSTDERQTASNLAETQMEYVKGQAYFVSYNSAPIPPQYVGYTVSIDVASLQDSSIQKVTVTAGRPGKVPVKLEAYKVR